MKGKVVGVCGIIAVLGIVSTVMGFVAEADRVKISKVYIVEFSCVYPHSSSFELGIVAAIFTLINRIFIFVLVGSCCRSCVLTSTPFSSLFNILSWITSFVAVFLLLEAAMLTNREGGEIDSNGITTCYVVKPGIFGAGAVLSFLSAIFGIVAYISVSLTMQTTLNPELALPVASTVDLEKALSKAMNSDSIVDLAITACLNDVHDIVAPPSVNKYPLVALESFVSDIKFASQCPLITAGYLLLT
ncbi:uncharacterized protein [Rutidosis leptorrhynchoides]|uniref:uncharacterized protein n=1 Tax=Rutidosis leptorrhynchoides TaxID=125765 RepID=UPI003A992D54